MTENDGAELGALLGAADYSTMILQETPSIDTDRSPTNVTVALGKTALLTCRVRGWNNRTVRMASLYKKNISRISEEKSRTDQCGIRCNYHGDDISQRPSKAQLVVNNELAHSIRPYRSRGKNGIHLSAVRTLLFSLLFRTLTFKWSRSCRCTVTWLNRHWKSGKSERQAEIEIVPRM